MAEPHVVTALIEKRRELAGQIEHLQGQVRQAVIALDHVEGALRVFQPGVALPDVRPRKVQPSGRAAKGEITHVIRTTLRAAKAPLTTQEIALHVLAARGLDAQSAGLVRIEAKRTARCLRELRNHEVVRSEYRAGDGLTVWAVARA